MNIDIIHLEDRRCLYCKKKLWFPIHFCKGGQQVNAR